MESMSSGELRHLMQLEALSFSGVSDNGDYASEETWGVVSEIWANIDFRSAKEDSDSRDYTQGKATVKIRWRDDVSNKMRLTYQGRVYDIEDSFHAYGKRQYLMLNTVVSEGPSANELAIIDLSPSHMVAQLDEELGAENWRGDTTPIPNDISDAVSALDGAID